MATDTSDTLLDGLVRYAYQYRPDAPFTLASGASSPEYLDCRIALSHPEVLQAAAERIVARLPDELVAVGGMTMGADPLAVAVSLVAKTQGRQLCWFSIRKEAKAHGQGRRIEGDIQPGAHVCVLEDVTTSGGSAAQAVQVLQDFGVHVQQIASVVDREAGGIQRLAEETAPPFGAYALTTLSAVRAHYMSKQPT